ncbi:MAG: hypothetical protein WBJ36_00375 [Tenuifilum sp.]|uniref:hypothetical protein n=1 Tax=Tenuifilum sp. TaxID=2760880 RepID=UPI0016B4D0FA|nr:hypothetical protein [Candidatus Methanofastidiosa archaeon]HOK60413.1 hypothetical protein [Tenuifilum sp.]HOK85743.1 hypothetical protein [Tenuifilum sp.]HPP90107.1 hypothetical protein [Tenuifilum sp.]
MGLGGGGSLTLEHYYNQGLQAKLTCIASKELPKFPSKIKSIHCNVPKKYDSIDDWSNYYIALPDEVKSVFDSNEHFIILVGLGGLTGTLLGKSIFKLLNNRNANSMSFS